ncbi:TetR/AcrR family transcriptional regulator [Bradyrhizobium erythrophlei]|uniref:TetR/AcrR family transcriptional regulator n=1 Tax=Bradyrhizobium erythrophlei TaxID=1437360 RepID=UPI0035E48B4B
MPAKQARSRATRDALVGAGRKLCEIKSFDDLSVAEIAAAAQCSVGSFYSRFADKDGFFRALINDVVDRDSAFMHSPLDCAEHLSTEEILADAIATTLKAYRKRRGLIRAAIRRSMTDPTVWEPFRLHGQAIADRLVARLLPRFPNDPDIERRTRFACQMLYGTLNNAVLIAPGPIQLDDDTFEPELRRVFHQITIGSGASDRPPDDKRD